MNESLGTPREEFEIASGYWRKWQRCEKEKADLLEAAKALVAVFEDMQNGIEPDEGMQFLDFADTAIKEAEGKS